MNYRVSNLAGSDSKVSGSHDQLRERFSGAQRDGATVVAMQDALERLVQHLL